VREAIPSWAHHFVRSEREDLVVDSSLRASMTVRRADLFTFTPFGTYDVILCRNVLIYLAKPARERLVRRLVSWLAPDGAIGTGHADNAMDLLGDFTPVGPTGAFLFERAAAPAPVPATRHAPPPVRREAPRPVAAPAIPSRPAPRAQPPSRRDDLEAALRREPDRLDLLLELAELHVAAGDVARAEDAFRRIVYLDAKHEHALVRLADLAERQGKSDVAARFRSRALDAHLEREE
jgi:tetratricopeptide (TPR) repeat protein